MKVKKVTSLGKTPKAPITYVRKLVTRSSSIKQPKPCVIIQKKGKGLPKDFKTVLQERKKVLQEEHQGQK